MEISVGIKVAARGLEWDVTEVEQLGAQRRVRLACSAGDLRGLEWDVLYPALVLEVRLIRLRHPAANNLVYTEYGDTQCAALDALRAADGIEGTVLTISGADPEADRTRAAERCAEEDGIILVSTDSLAEGLNLHQRCFHLIHLDLPYNPNRLEQRNGRIDRYGQRNDPEIRYLYLAGTFEERLLLRLIAKYEKARACLSVMPNTLAVTADADSLDKGLLAGFAEDQESLFNDGPPLIQSLDVAAGAADDALYRDLLREIDRAFEGFDHMAVRHGWTDGRDDVETPPEPPQPGIDLAAFVASAVAAETGGTADLDGLLLPADWARDLEGLPGFDPVRRKVRLTSNPARSQDDRGRTLMYPGRAHPLVRRAVACASRTGRVSAARGDRVSLLMTYAVEVRGQGGALLRRVFALRVDPSEIIEQPAGWLSLAGPGDHLAAEGLWGRWFAGWAGDQIQAAGLVAAAVADRLAADFTAAHLARIGEEAAVAQAWLERRAGEICGPLVRRTGDLFDQAPKAADWRSCPASDERLALCAADPSAGAPRQEAAEALDRFRTLVGDHAARSTLSPPMLQALGMLMIVPHDA